MTYCLTSDRTGVLLGVIITEDKYITEVMYAMLELSLTCCPYVDHHDYYKYHNSCSYSNHYYNWYNYDNYWKTIEA